MTVTQITPFISSIVSGICFAYFMSRTFRPDNEKKVFILFFLLLFLTELIILFVPTLHFLSLINVFLFVLFYFKKHILQKLSALLFQFSLIFCGQTLCTILFWYIPSVLTGQKLYMNVNQAQSNSPIYIVFFCFNLLSLFATAIIGTYLWNQIYHFLNLGIVCCLFLYPHIICLEPLIYLSKLQTDYIVIFILILLCIAGNLSVFYGLHRLHIVLAHTEDYLYQKKLIHIQLNSCQNLEQRHLEIRRWNHDMSNHLLTIEYMLNNSEMQEASSYLLSLIQTTESPESITSGGIL